VLLFGSNLILSQPHHDLPHKKSYIQPHLQVIQAIHFNKPLLPPKPTHQILANKISHTTICETQKTSEKMKLLTLNFLSCAVKACKSTSTSFPLHPKDCELVSDTIEPNPKLIYNVLPRIDWVALTTTASEVLTPPFSTTPHAQERVPLIL